MPQRVEITVTAEQTASLVQHISAIPGVIGLRVQHGGSIRPAGDIISLDVTNRSLPAVARLMVESGIGRSTDTSFSTSEPTTLVSSSFASAITNDSSEAIWEEMEVVMGKNSNMTLNGLIVMAIAGVLATIGIATNALHIVIGAMLIAPGFQPLVRIALGVIGEGAAWRRGALHTLQGYAALVAGAAVTAWLLQAIGKSPLGGESSYLPAGVLISYWTTITIPSVVVTVVSGAAGAILVATNRAVLTAGVMVGLSLVPGAAIAGLAAASGEFDIALQGVVRWLMEAGIVLLMSLLVFAWKRTFVHNRAMVL